MRLSQKFILGTLSVFAACTARGPSSVDRSPAADSAPIGPGNYRGGSPNASGSLGSRNPIFPRAPGAAPSQPSGDDHSRPESRRDVSSVDDGTLPDSRVGCSDESLMSVHVGDGFSAHDVLLRISVEGTFSGRTRIPRMRQVPLTGGASYWINDFATAIEYDRRTLSKWFSNSSPDVKDSDIYEAIRSSEPYKYAAQFVNSNTPMLVFRDQYDIGHRMASLLSVMLAVASQGDPDCVAHISKEWMPKLLPNAEAQALMNQIRSQEAAQLVKEGRIHNVFGELAANRQSIQEQIRKLDETLKKKESENQVAIRGLQTQMQNAYRSLRSEIMEVAPCRTYVTSQESFTAGTTPPQAFADNLVESCITRLNSMLADARNEQSRLHAELQVNEARRTHAEEALFRAERDGRPGEVARREEAIAAYDKKIELLRTRNEAVAEKSQKYADYVAHLTEGESNSVSLELRRIGELLGEHQTRLRPDYFKAENQQMERLNGNLKANSTHYLTTGFFGGFGAGDPAGTFPR